MGPFYLLGVFSEKPAFSVKALLNVAKRHYRLSDTTIVWRGTSTNGLKRHYKEKTTMLMLKKFIMGELTNRALGILWKVPEKARGSVNRTFLAVFTGLFLRTVRTVIFITCVSEYLYPVSSVPLAVTFAVAPYYFMAMLFVREVSAEIKLGYTSQYQA